MHQFFLVDASTEYLSLFCYELRKRPDGLYERMDENAMFNDINREQFFGNLNSLCVTKEQIKAPKLPLKPAAIPVDVQESAHTQAETVAHYTEQARQAYQSNRAEVAVEWRGATIADLDKVVDETLAASKVGCWASVPANSTGEEAYTCGKPTVGETGFCKDHQESV